MDDQQRVAAFLERHDLEAPPAYRLLDLAAEFGELATDAVESAEYGQSPEQLTVPPDEVGDALFALLAFADAVDVDASDALGEAIRKYERRLEDTGSASSGM